MFNNTPHSALSHHSLPQGAREERSVAVGNKVMDTRLPQPVGCGDKYDVSGLGLKRRFNSCCPFFKYPSPDAKASPSPARGEGLYRPWCNKILGTDCASRPRMTGGRGANSFGRSMIEMLGVLAIIAVLSVGGIAGYSKAMQIYKLNKWKEDFITLTANLKIAFINSRSYTDIEENDLTNFYKELNIVPQGMLTSSNQDIFGNKFTLFARHNPQWNLNTVHFTIQIDTLPNSFSVEECKTVFELAQHYDDNWSVVLNQNISGLNGILRICGKSLPKEFAQNVSCQQYNVTTIAKKCSVCGKQNCDIKFVINNCS